MNPEEVKILERCVRLFMRYGVKSITMDDVARELGISKKTLYIYFSNKNDLVNKVTEFHFVQENQAICALSSQSKNAIDEMLNMSRWISTQMTSINPVLIYDLRKHHPEAWQLFVSHRNTEIYQSIYNNIKRGIEEGLYRDDVHVEIITRIYIGRMEVVIDPEIFPPDSFSFQEIHREFILYHLRGIASKKGQQYLEKIQNQLYA